MIFITVEQALSFHAHVINQTGGSHGIRDLGLLISALETPKATMFGEFLHPSIYDMASAYLFHIIGNHPFIDGNKRTACAVMWTFLDVNNLDLEFDEFEFENYVVDIAQGKHDKTAIAEYLFNLSVDC